MSGMSKKQERAALQAHEMQLWRTWKSDPSDANMVALIESLDKVITRKVNEFKTAPVPPAAVRGVAQAMAMKAIQNYDPDKGAQLGSYVFTNLRKVHDFVGRYQNLGRIPIHRIRKITDYKDALRTLEDRYGRVPTNQELLTYLRANTDKPENWATVAEVDRMQQELARRDLIASFEEPDSQTENEGLREREVLRYIEEELEEDEKLVFQYTLGVGGMPKLPAGEIAKIMDISKPRVSRIRNRISEKLRNRGV